MRLLEVELRLMHALRQFARLAAIVSLNLLGCVGSKYIVLVLQLVLMGLGVMTHHHVHHGHLVYRLHPRPIHRHLVSNELLIKHKTALCIK